MLPSIHYLHTLLRETCISLEQTWSIEFGARPKILGGLVGIFKKINIGFCHQCLKYRLRILSLLSELMSLEYVFRSLRIENYGLDEIVM